jgi:type VI secretion system protein VasD
MLLAATLLAVPLATGGCRSETVAVQSPKRCELQIVTLTIVSSPHINPAPNDDARPVMVRIYQLKSDIRLENASFESIWKEEKNTLLDDVVKVDELPIYPNSRTEVHFERDPAALTIAAVGLFREPKGRSWYYSFDLPAAPGKGLCGGAVVAPPDCKDGSCDAGADGGSGPDLRPRFSFWIDGSRIDDGADHLEEPTAGTRVNVVRLTGSGATSGSASAAPAK